MPKENCRSHAPSDRKYKSFYSIGALVDSGRPERVGERHLLDECSQLGAHWRTPWPSTSRLPGPEGPEPLPMPADDEASRQPDLANRGAALRRSAEIKH